MQFIPLLSTFSCNKYNRLITGFHFLKTSRSKTFHSAASELWTCEAQREDADTVRKFSPATSFKPASPNGKYLHPCTRSWWDIWYRNDQRMSKNISTFHDSSAQSPEHVNSPQEYLLIPPTPIAAGTRQSIWRTWWMSHKVHLWPARSTSLTGVGLPSQWDLSSMWRSW